MKFGIKKNQYIEKSIAAIIIYIIFDWPVCKMMRVNPGTLEEASIVNRTCYKILLKATPMEKRLMASLLAAAIAMLTLFHYFPATRYSTDESISKDCRAFLWEYDVDSMAIFERTGLMIHGAFAERRRMSSLLFPWNDRKDFSRSQVILILSGVEHDTKMACGKDWQIDMHKSIPVNNVLKYAFDDTSLPPDTLKCQLHLLDNGKYTGRSIPFYLTVRGSCQSLTELPENFRRR